MSNQLAAMPVYELLNRYVNARRDFDRSDEFDDESEGVIAAIRAELERRTIPPNVKFFSYDALNDDFAIHDTAEEARKTAQGFIDECLDSEGWYEEVEGVRWGIIMEQACVVSAERAPDPPEWMAQDDSLDTEDQIEERLSWQDEYPNWPEHETTIQYELRPSGLRGIDYDCLKKGERRSVDGPPVASPVTGNTE